MAQQFVSYLFLEINFSLKFFSLNFRKKLFIIHQNIFYYTTPISHNNTDKISFFINKMTSCNVTTLSQPTTSSTSSYLTRIP